MKKYYQVVIVSLTVAVSACASNPPVATSEPIDTTQNSPVVNPVTIDGVQDGTEIEPTSLAARAPLERVIYFDYNKAELLPQYIEIVSLHGRFMAENPEATVRLEGHTDERGTREYNIALGEDRANTVARILQLQGVNADQLRTVSYGEELPVDEAHNSDAWAKNRRVNVIYEVTVQN